MTSYSQQGEDLRICELLAEVPRGTLLDLGAWHPTQLSNSRALIEASWRAVLVEPSPEPFLWLLREYGNNPNVQLLHAAIGFERSFAPIHATADAVSTMDESVHERWREKGGYYGKFWTPVFTIEDFWNQFGGDFQFVNIDTEGSSADLFLRWMDSQNRPRVMCVEHDNRTQEIAARALAEGYRIELLNQTNIVLALRNA